MKRSYFENVEFRNISQSSKDRLGKLYQRSGAWDLLPWNNLRARIITELGDSLEPGLIPDLAGYALDGSVKTREATNLAISKLLSAIPVSDLLGFDAFTREYSGSWHYQNDTWSKLSPSETKKFAAETETGLLALASMHSNGRIREASLRVLSTLTSGEELPFLILRANDWVAPIRELIRIELTARLKPNYAIHFMKSLPLILQIECGGRASHRWLVEAVGSLLTRTECQAVLQEGLDSERRVIRKACLRFVDAADVWTARRPLQAAMKDPDSMIRLWAAKRLLATANANELPALCSSLENDPFMPVRRETLNARVRCPDEQLRSALQKALLDRHFSMRDLARFHLKIGYETAQFYRDCITKTDRRKIAIAILGLGECGLEGDANLIAQFTKSSERKIREYSVTALGRLASQRFSETLLHALADEAPSVSIAARTALQTIKLPIGSKAIGAFLMLNHPPHVRKNALHLASQLSKWDQISVFIRSCRDPDESVSVLAIRKVQIWKARYNRNYTVNPTNEQITEATEELRHSQEFLDSWTVRNLESLCKDWTR